MVRCWPRGLRRKRLNCENPMGRWSRRWEGTGIMWRVARGTQTGRCWRRGLGTRRFDCGNPMGRWSGRWKGTGVMCCVARGTRTGRCWPRGLVTRRLSCGNPMGRWSRRWKGTGVGCSVARGTLAFGNVSRGVSPILLLSQNLGSTCGRAAAVNIYLIDDVLDVARSYLIRCLRACVD